MAVSKEFHISRLNGTYTSAGGNQSRNSATMAYSSFFRWPLLFSDDASPEFVIRAMVTAVSLACLLFDIR